MRKKAALPARFLKSNFDVKINVIKFSYRIDLQKLSDGADKEKITHSHSLLGMKLAAIIHM